MVRRDKVHIILLVCAVVLCLAANGSVASGGAGRQQPLSGTAALADGLPQETPESAGTAEAVPEPEADDTVPLYINGVLVSDCLLVDGTARMSLGCFATLAGLSYDGHSIGGVEPKLAASGEYAEVNGRYFYLPDGLYELGGELLWPLRELAKMFSCGVYWDPASGSIDLDMTGLGLLESGDEFYGEQDVFWLSRIIYAESGNQPLAGQIGVGSVVLNRVADPAFPDSVFEVIFDRSYGVQFSPVETGSIYTVPDEEAVVAAKLCLDGYNTVGRSLYFVNPQIGAGGWFAANFTLTASIGDHDFYA